ncbi:MAG: methyltransferase domain-containing protein [Solirubrobacteraceae bacterium MAG38_C4-C5]|nr:methyltransferase domain-containing protein [Candidatus Siliceabacter maunaloa]
MEAGDDLSFLAAPGQVADWRMVLAHEAAMEAGVLGALPATPAELAAQLGLEEPALRALLDALMVWSLVEVDEHGRYASRAGASSSEKDAVLRQHAVVIRRWATFLGDRLADRTASSEPPASRVPPEVFFNFLAANARRLIPGVLDACTRRFGRVERVLDLGGGHGEYSLELARRGLRPMMQDLPDVVELVDRGQRLTEGGVELFPGDFHATLPPGPFDLVLCAGVTHTFDGRRNLDLYRRLRAIIAPGGGLAIVTFLRARNPVASIFALQMLVATEGGDAHGEEDYRRWLGEAGYGPLELADVEGRPQTVVLAGI